MDALTLVITILQLLCGLAVIVIVLFQSGKSAGLSGAIGGVADSFLSRNKAKTLDAKLARATKWVGAIFLILTLVLLRVPAHRALFYMSPEQYSTPASGWIPLASSSSCTVTKR